jgi:hypothetical protein
MEDIASLLSAEEFVENVIPLTEDGNKSPFQITRAPATRKTPCASWLLFNSLYFRESVSTGFTFFSRRELTLLSFVEKISHG